MDNILILLCFRRRKWDLGISTEGGTSEYLLQVNLKRMEILYVEIKASVYGQVVLIDIQLYNGATSPPLPA